MTPFALSILEVIYFAVHAQLHFVSFRSRAFALLILEVIYSAVLAQLHFVSLTGFRPISLQEHICPCASTGRCVLSSWHCSMLICTLYHFSIFCLCINHFSMHNISYTLVKTYHFLAIYLCISNKKGKMIHFVYIFPFLL